MALPSVTNTFSNGTTADATQVNSNFTDLINSMTDGSKSFSIDALTCAGAATFNGAVTLGNGTPDDITVSGALASSIPIKTNNSFDIGSATLGLAGVYLGAPSSRSTRLRAHQSLGASNTLVLPNGGGTAEYEMCTDGSGNLDFRAPPAGFLRNFSIAASVGTNALTIALKDASGSDPSASSPVGITFRSSTATSGAPVIRQVTAATSVVVSSGSTLGHASGQTQYVYVYAIDNAGTIELAVSSQLLSDTGSLVTTTAEGGGGAADSGTVLYSTTSRSNVPIRLIGRIKSNQSAAGTWASSPTEISIAPFERVTPVSSVYCDSGSSAGSTYTKIRRYTNSTTVGTGLTYADSPANGMSITVNENGLYSISMSDAGSGGTQILGVSVNEVLATTGTTGSTGVTYAQGFRILSYGAGATVVGSLSITLRLTAGDVVRARVDSATQNVVYCMFNIIKVGD